jgi:hypothetical protein
MPTPVLVLQVVRRTATVRFITANAVMYCHVAMLVFSFKACSYELQVVIGHSTNYKLLCLSCAEIAVVQIALLASDNTAHRCAILFADFIHHYINSYASAATSLSAKATCIIQ